MTTSPSVAGVRAIALMFDRIERKLDDLTKSVATLHESKLETQKLLAATERERDKHRADAAAAREAALRVVAAAQEANSAMSGLLGVLQRQQDALVQLLAPGSLADLLPVGAEDD